MMGLGRKGLSGVLLTLIIVALVAVIFFAWSPAIAKTLNSLVYCKDKGGECLPSNTLDRERLGGFWKDCQDLADKKGREMACFWKVEFRGGGMDLAGETAPEKGLNLRMATYAQLTDPVPPHAEQNPAGDIVSKKALAQGETVQLIAKRRYAFYGLVYNDPGYPVCSIYIRNGGYSTGNNLYGTDSKGACNDAALWSKPLVYVPSNSDVKKDLQLVMVKLKSPEGHHPGSEPSDLVGVIHLKVQETPAFSYSSFLNYPGTNVDALLSGAYLDNPDGVDFSLENANMKIRFKDVKFNGVQNPDLNFDQIISYDTTLGQLTIDGTRLKYLSGNVKVPITIKATRWKAPPTPRLGAWEYTSAVSPSQETERKLFKMCAFCDQITARADGSISFNADIAGRYVAFRVFPGSCQAIKTKDDCLNVPIRLESLDCVWKNEVCMPCAGSVKGCGDYKDTDFCAADTCNVDKDALFVPSCTWTSRWSFFPDGCVDCKDRAKCGDYNNEYACKSNACNIQASCAWSGEGTGQANKCVNCNTVAKCSDYDTIKKDKNFCEANVCGKGIGCSFDRTCQDRTG